MQFTVFGAGLMGRYIVNDLTSQLDASVTWIDRSQEALEQGAMSLSSRERVTLVEAAITPGARFTEHIKPGSVAIGASSYEHHLQLTKDALAAGAHWLDLGGNNDVVQAQRALSEEAQAAGLRMIPDCGLAPGMVSILGWDLHEQCPQADSIELRVGGLPAQPKNRLGYQLVFSARGLLNEYREPCTVLRDGALITVDPMTELESLSLGSRFPELEAFTTSGGISTLAESLVGRVAHADYKTIRYPGHAEVIATMMELGFFSDKPVGTNGLSAFDVSANLLEDALVSSDPDVVLVIARAKKGDAVVAEWKSIVDADQEWTAMQRSTGASAAVVAELIAKGQVSKAGVLTQEESLPARDYVAGLTRRGIDLKFSKHV